MKLNPNDFSDQSAMAEYTIAPAISTATSYNKPGLPKPPGGWGMVPPMTDSVDNDDEGPESKDEN